jgi:catechol 2,3-dioxygenase-like lactoylglutathione lyase family enzyme
VTVPRTCLLLPAATLLLAMGLSRRRRFQAERILRISRVVSDLDRAEAFYRDGLGFRVIARGRSDQGTLAALGAGDIGAVEVVMRLGAQDIALVQFARRGRRYPRDSRSDDLWFQHLAIVVNDMDLAYAHLSSHAGWCPISEGGPQLLPPSNGAMRAFKFRDPDRHPLELNLVSDLAGPRCVAPKSVRRIIPRYRPQRAFRCFYVPQPRILSRAGLAGE